MNYTEIQIGNKPVPCYYGTGAVASLEERGIDIGEALDSMKAGKLFFYHGLAIVYEGIKEGHRRANKPFMLSEADVADWIDGDFSLIQKCVDVLAKSNFMQRLIEAAEKNVDSTNESTFSENGVKKKSNRSRELMKSRK